MREISYREALREAISEEMQKDKAVFMLGEDVGKFGGVYRVTKGLFGKFGPERVRDTPISESAIIGAAIGAALVGMRPIAEIMSINFITLAMDQIVNECAKLRYMTGGQARLPLVIRTAGGAGRYAAAVHSQSLEAWFLHTPGLKVVMPSTPYDAKGLLKTAIRDDNPVMFIEHLLLYDKVGPVPEEEYLLPLGQARVVKPGSDLTIVATSLMLHKVLEVAEQLESRNMSVEVIDPRTLNPLDLATIVASVQKTGRLMIVHEACQTGGMGAEIAALVADEAFDYLDAPIKRVAGADTAIPYSPPLEEAAIPDQERIKKSIEELLGQT